MKKRIAIILLSLLWQLVSANQVVVLLHGLARTADSMEPLEAALEVEGYEVLNIEYESRKAPVQALAKTIRKQIMTATRDASKVHFVTHSMGGIIVRQIQTSAPIPNLGRVVMLSPPNHGSEVVDKIGSTWFFKKLNGPAGQQLGTHPDGFINQLGPVKFELGILTGDRSINWINSIMIPGEDDGKVSTASAKIERMQAYKVLHVTHPMIMKDTEAIEETLHFIQTGRFK